MFIVELAVPPQNVIPHMTSYVLGVKPYSLTQ